MAKKRRQVAHLQIGSFQGFCPDACHYHATLWAGDERIELEYLLSAAQARQLNKDDRRRLQSIDYKWKKGQPSRRFFTEQQAEEFAIGYLKEHYPKIEVLIRGSNATADPRPVLMAPERLKTTLESLYAAAEANDFWDGDEATMEEISNEWIGIIDGYLAGN